jgi:ferredoxin
MVSIVRSDFNAQVQEAWLAPHVWAGGFTAVSQNYLGNAPNNSRDFTIGSSLLPDSLFMGLMNRFSLLKVKKLDAECLQCGACDASCPVGLVELGSGYQYYQSNPSKRYACIRCLNCVSSCPEGALVFVGGKIKTVP